MIVVIFNFDSAGGGGVTMTLSGYIWRFPFMDAFNIVPTEIFFGNREVLATDVVCSYSIAWYQGHQAPLHAGFG